MMSLNELMDAAHGVSNMYLAHEIAVDKDFMLEKLKPEESEMEIQVKKIVHQVCQKYKGDLNTERLISGDPKTGHVRFSNGRL